MANSASALGPGYRRRILIESAPDHVTAELEDDYHRMVVTLRHSGGVVTEVESEMKRSPWTGCPGAMQRLRDTFAGVALADVARRGEKTSNCTHLHDLALFAAAHAADAGPIAYEIHVGDPEDGTREGPRTARLWRGGVPLIEWQLDGSTLSAPEELAGRTLFDLGSYVATLDPAMAEAVRILRWATIVGHGRTIDIPAELSATAYATGNCYNFQPERAVNSTRRPGADVDLSAPGNEPMADRSEAFAAF
jgi:Protein of unknown function (DUF2889)